MTQTMHQRPSTAASATNIRHNDYITAPHDQFLQWAEDNGVVAPALILYQWVRANAPHKSLKNRSLGVMLKDDCVLVCDHSTGERFHFQGVHSGNPSRSSSDATASKRKQVTAREEERARQDALYETTAGDVAMQWAEAVIMPVSGYMAAKGLSDTHGARWCRRYECWLIPLNDVNKKLWSVQRIYNRHGDNKRFTKGGKKTGCFALLGKLDITTSLIFVCEGFGTGASLREGTGNVVACAMDAGNLQAVCEAIQGAYPDISIVVCGDDDRASEPNQGRQKANAAAASVGAKVRFPKFCEDCKKGCTDFNDTYQCWKNRGAAQ